jgi:dATP/dGTP diphosphohydrolase
MVKESNPKDRFGVQKASLSYVPSQVVMEVALGMQEGGYKYGRHNYRVIGVRGSVYYDAASRHLMAWWEGEDLDPHSGAGLHHVSKAIASLMVLRDAMTNGRGLFVDDRPPMLETGWLERLSEKVPVLAKSFPDPVAPYTQTVIAGYSHPLPRR